MGHSPRGPPEVDPDAQGTNNLSYDYERVNCIVIVFMTVANTLYTHP